MYRYHRTAENAANEAITQLFAQSPADAPPSAELIGKTACRSAELTAQLSMLKQVEAVVRQVLARTERRISKWSYFPMFVNPSAWEDYKIRNFSSMDENVVHYWQPWLMKIDQCVDHTDHPASSSTTLLITLQGFLFHYTQLLHDEW